jgi:hypothetical protein
MKNSTIVERRLAKECLQRSEHQFFATRPPQDQSSQGSERSRESSSSTLASIITYALIPISFLEVWETSAFAPHASAKLMYAILIIRQKRLVEATRFNEDEITTSPAFATRERESWARYDGRHIEALGHFDTALHHTTDSMNLAQRA